MSKLYHVVASYRGTVLADSTVAMRLADADPGFFDPGSRMLWSCPVSAQRMVGVVQDTLGSQYRVWLEDHNA
jgi:hypothetical protein